MSKAEQIFDSIESIAAQRTERKQPGSASGSTAQFYTGDQPPAPVPPQQGEQAQQATGSITEKEIKSSGVSGAFVASTISDCVFGLTERIVFVTRLSHEEKERLQEIDELPEDQLTPADIRLLRKFNAIYKKHEKIREKIECSEEDMQILKTIFEEHSRATGKPLSPNLIIYAGIIKLLANKAIDIFL